MVRLSSALIVLTLISLLQPVLPAQIQQQALRRLEDDYWDFALRERPDLGLVAGEVRYNDRLPNYSLAHVQEVKAQEEGLLRRALAIDTSQSGEQEQLDKALLVRLLKDRLESIRWKTYEMPVDQFNGVQIWLPQIATLAPFNTVRHYQDWIARLHQVPRVLNQVTEVLRHGMQDHLMPPRYLLEKAVEQTRLLASARGLANPFAAPATHIPANFAAADRKRLREGIVAAVDNEVRPAYTQFQEFLSSNYAPKGRSEFGIWSLPDGDARYRFAIHLQSSMDLPPAQIHQLGLTQVAEVEKQIAALAKKAGYPDAKSFTTAVHADPRLKAKSREQILDNFRHYIAQMEPKLPQLFGLLPKNRLVVTSVPAYMEKDSSTQYQPGSADGSRAGQVWVDTYDPTQHDMLDDEATAYHEGVPGHHMQISITLERPGLHPFHRESADVMNAYVEGWALYAERLGKEVGFYQAPASDLGRLQSELFRAVRLVVDTGVHYKHWTRQQMADYFQQHMGFLEQAEIDRYIAWPGQALGYKLGQLKIIELREKAHAQLGKKFDLRSFHDEVLSAGPMPLDLLQTRVENWLARQR
ncbi:MAG TPA: DUF885 domain-containing protein [Bryobacteraceae bacterium]|nr:DUF885 domain-containing protein [Bryobacteraceae bacterium]